MSEVESVREALPKGTSKILEVNVGGAQIRVKTDTTPAVLKRTKDLVQSNYDEISEKAVGLSAHQKTLLVALNLAEELISEREKLRDLRRKVLESSDALINRVESHLSKAES